MPIGSAKIGVLGAGLVPGGTQTFNASGTFTVPPGVKKINITGKGGTGNPGNAGNAGNPGNVGNGGTGGGGGATSGSSNCPNCIGYYTFTGGASGWAYKSCFVNLPGVNSLALNLNAYPIIPWINSGTAPPSYSPGIAVGAGNINVNNQGIITPRTNAQSGSAGNSGTAGNPGNAGTAGNASSGFCKNFPGGAGGNAGVGGAGGSGGSAGGAGNDGGNYGNGAAGSGGSGGAGGSGGSGGNTKANAGQNANLASGGGGAGVTNSGASGLNSNVEPFPASVPRNNQFYARGGNSPEFSANFPCGLIYNCYPQPQPPSVVPANMTGGITSRYSITSANSFITSPPCPSCNGIVSTRDQLSDYGSPNTGTSNIWRSGAGGGSSGTMPHQPFWVNYGIGGGGGGGGRGGAAGTGGNSSAPSGSAATPQTFNCVPVTPGSPYPITVASPGGQVVISWNPQ